jgi:HEAT repeat protein
LKTHHNPEIDIDLVNFPDNLVGLIKELMDDKNYSAKIYAAKVLVRMGKRIIPQLHKLLSSKNDLLREEIARMVKLIADRRSVPVLIGLLDDIVFDIRWIAAEGLIRIGRRSIRPLIKSIRDGKSSIALNQSAHHVLDSLLNKKEKRG